MQKGVTGNIYPALQVERLAALLRKSILWTSKSYLLLIKTNGDTDQVFTSNFSYLFLSVHSRRKLCTNLKSHLKLQTSELFLLLNTELQKNHFHSCHITKSYWINLGKLITQAFKIKTTTQISWKQIQF